MRATPSHSEPAPRVQESAVVEASGQLAPSRSRITLEPKRRLYESLVPLALQHQSEVGCEALSSDVLNFELLHIIRQKRVHRTISNYFSAS